MKRVYSGARWLLVLVGVVMLTSFTIDATDSLQNSNTALSGLIGAWSNERCPQNMTEVTQAGTTYCIDTYENSVGEGCPIESPKSALESKENIDTSACQSQSVADAIPWTAVTFHQAKSLCVKRGLQLPTPAEWFEAALGTPADTRCNINANTKATGAQAECRSFSGVYDMVGNVWEWTDGQVQDGVYGTRTLPSEGYVAAVAADGLATETAAQPDPLYDMGYFWHNPQGEYVMMRGGFYDSQDDASVYTTHTKVTTDFHSGAVGFRCSTTL